MAKGKMSKGLKIGLILGATGAAVAATVFIIKKVKNKNSTDSGSNGGSSDYSGEVLKLSVIDARPNSVVFDLKGESRTRTKADKDDFVGQDVLIKGTGTKLDGNTYTIKDIWIDTNGKIGAIYVNADPSGITKTKLSGNATATLPY